MSLSVRLAHPETAPAWLVGNPWEYGRRESRVLTETFQIGRNTQAQAGAGWRSKKHFDRKGQSISFECSSKIEYATAFEQLDAIASLAPVDAEDQAHEWSGSVFLRKVAGDYWEEWEIPEAVVTLTNIQPVGDVSLELRYRVQGPGIKRDSTSGLYDWLLDTNGQPILDSNGLRTAGVDHDA